MMQGVLKVDKEKYLAQHDIVFRAPPAHGWEGLPLGNGSLGGPLWTDDKGYVFQINHTNPFERPVTDRENDEKGKFSLRSCGRLYVKFAAPVFDWLYLNDFEARLSLYRAEADFNARTAFGACQAKAWIQAGAPVFIMRHKVAYSESVGKQGAPIKVILEHWASRMLPGWYGTISGGAGRSFAEAEASLDGKDVCLNVNFRGVAVCLRCRVKGAPAVVRLNHSRQAELEIEARPEQDFTVYLSCVTSVESNDPQREAKKALDDVAAEQNPRETHRQWWAFFWSKSFLHIPENYFENLYYLHHYLMASCSRGKYPPLFCGGLWTWNRDVRHWSDPHHWNEQQAFWSLLAADHAELLKPFLDVYHRLMPEAIAATRRRGFQGMIWMDKHDFLGRQLGEAGKDMKYNFTPAAQISMFYWWHYRYTGDRAYLREKGYPFMAAAGDFFLDFLKWRADKNCYEVPPSSTYEDDRFVYFTDAVTTLSMVKALFSALEQASVALGVDGDKRKKWRQVLDHLPPYQLNDRDKARGVTLASGLIDGKTLPETEPHSHGPVFCPVFPAGDIGLERRDEIFEAACHTLKTYPPAFGAITPVVSIAARLGLADECLKWLDNLVRMCQHFPNGLFFNLWHWHYLSRHAGRSDSGADIPGKYFNLKYWLDRKQELDDSPAFQRDYVLDEGCCYKNVNVSACPEEDIAGHKADTPCRPFIQPGLETLGHFADGIQQMLLQSYAGWIRVCPAIPQTWECAFTLLAEGGFLVSAVCRPGRQVGFLEILSRRGGVCRLVLPWAAKTEVRGDNQAVAFQQEENGKIVFATVAGGTYMIKPLNAPLPPPENFAGERNASAKYYHEAILGKPRNY